MDVQQISQLLQYEPETGRLLWQRNQGRIRAGTLAGSINGQGYLCVGVLCKRYLAHRLAWLLTHGSWPSGQIDHVNGDRLDNRLANLRVVTNRQNGQNRPVHRAGRLTGCRYHRQARRWQARIEIQGKRRCLGYYDTEQEAHEAYLRALQEITYELGAAGYATWLEAVRSATNSNKPNGDLS